LPSIWSGIGNQEQTVVVKDIAAIARRAFGAITDPHANGGLFVGGVAAPIWFFANAAPSVFGNSAEAVSCNSLSLRKVDDPVLVGIRNIC
jgi:hypothetical protein